MGKQPDMFAARQLDIFDPLAANFDHFEWPEEIAPVTPEERAELEARHDMVWMPRVEFNKLRERVWRVEQTCIDATTPFQIVERGKDPIVWVKKSTLAKMRSALANKEAA